MALKKVSREFLNQKVNKSACKYRVTVVRPGPELHPAELFVEGEVLDVHLAGGVVDGGRLPLDQALRHRHQTKQFSFKIRQCH